MENAAKPKPGEIKKIIAKVSFETFILGCLKKFYRVFYFALVYVNFLYMIVSYTH